MNLPANTERAVTQGKRAAAARSLQNFRSRKRDELAEQKKSLSRQLAIAVTEQRRRELRAAIARNEKESREHEAACNQSKLLQTEQRHGPTADGDGIERRVATTSIALPIGDPITTRATGQVLKLHGYAARFNTYADFGDWRETIQPGAFASALKTSDVCCLYNHDFNYVLGRSANRTLRLYETGQGLEYYVDLLPDDGLCAMVADRIQRRDVSGCSFSFSDVTDTWVFKKGQPDTRIITSIGKLYDVGPVVFPAYRDTSVELLFEERSEELAAERVDGFRRYREAGQRQRDHALSRLESRLDRCRRPSTRIRDAKERFRRHQLNRVGRNLATHSTILS